VLAFEDRGDDRDLQHLADGIAGQVRDNLARLEGLRVAPRASVSALSRQGIDAREAGRLLDVEFVVCGSVRRSRDLLVIDARMTDVAAGDTCWEQEFDTGSTNLFAVQEEISRRVADRLHVHLSDAQLRAIGRAGTRNPDAYEHYLRGRQLFFRSNRKSIDDAVQMFQRAVAEDPSYALAYAGLADCYAYLFMYFNPGADNLKFASSHALALDRDLAEAHAARGLAVSLKQDYEEAEGEFEAAIRLDPHLFDAHYFYARTCFAQAKYDQACRHYEAASETDRDDAQALTLLGFTYRTMGKHELASEASARARARLERLLELDPDDPRTNYLLADALLQAGEREEAVRRAERAASLDPGDAYTVYGLACVYSRLGRIEEGIAALRRSVECGFGHKAWMENDSDLEALRGDPRYAQLLDTLPTPDR
jgi:TolB-like protein/Flp pilus assembly protein TadD